MRLGRLWWRRGRVPAGYLDDEVGRVRMLIGQIEAAGDDQMMAIDETYDKLLLVMKGGVCGSEGEEKGGTAMVYKRDCKAEEDCQW